MAAHRFSSRVSRLAFCFFLLLLLPAPRSLLPSLTLTAPRLSGHSFSMAIATVPGYKVRARTQEVRDYHYDDAKPGKPLRLLIPGGLIALATLSLIVYILVRVLYQSTMSPTMGYGLIGLLAPFYIGGVYLFSYGYCLYDVKKTIKMTLIIVFITLAAVIILAVLLILLKDADINIGGGGGGGGHSGGSSSGATGSWGGGSSSGSGGSSGGGSLNISLGGGSSSAPVASPHTHAAAEAGMAAGMAAGAVAAAALLPIKCRHCKRIYVPEDTGMVCPACGRKSDGTEHRIQDPT